MEDRKQTLMEEISDFVDCLHQKMDEVLYGDELEKLLFRGNILLGFISRSWVAQLP